MLIKIPTTDVPLSYYTGILGKLFSSDLGSVIYRLQPKMRAMVWIMKFVIYIIISREHEILIKPSPA